MMDAVLEAIDNAIEMAEEYAEVIDEECYKLDELIELTYFLME